MSNDETPPFVQGSETSREAAKQMRKSAPRMRKLVWEYMLMQRERGCTDEEAQRALGMDGSTQRPRRIELCKKGMVRRTASKRPGRSGKLAAVWAVAPGKEAEKP